MFKMNFALLAILNYFIVYTCAKNQARKFVYTEKFQGLPKISDFRLEEESLPELKNGGKRCFNFIIIFLKKFD